MLLQSVCGAKRDPSVQTFGDLLQCVLNTACTRARQAGCGVVYLVFDSYREDDLGGGGGLKNNTWKRRHGGEHLPVYSGITLRDKVPTGRKDGMSVFLRVASNKRQLIALFRDNFCSLLQRTPYPPLLMYAVVSRVGFMCTEREGKWEMAPCHPVDSIFCEADYGLLTCAVHHITASAGACPHVVVAVEDTDVVVGLIAQFRQLQASVGVQDPVLCVQRGKPRKIFDVGRAVARLEEMHGPCFCPVRHSQCGLARSVCVCVCVYDDIRWY